MSNIDELKSTGLKATLPRLKILEVFQNAKRRHMTAEDVYKLLLAEDIPLEALQSKDDKVAVPPLVGALLKNEQDVSLFEKLVFMQRHNR